MSAAAATKRDAIAFPAATPTSTKPVASPAAGGIQGRCSVGTEGEVATAGGVGAGAGDSEAATFKIVVAQLCRVIAGCSQLLRLRGSIGEREERALNAISARGSPVLLAAVEAYGANQDLEVRLDVL